MSFKLPGLYRGFVSDINDPLSQLRLRAYIPQQLGKTTQTGWALPCLDPYALQTVAGSQATPQNVLPAVGSTVWIMFEGGDINYPVWMGRWVSPGQTGALPFPPTNYMTLDTPQTVTAQKIFSVAPTVPDPLAALNPVNLEYVIANYLPLTSYKPGNFTENDQTGSGVVVLPMASGNVQQYTMTGNVTASSVTGAAKGMILVLRLKQDLTGGRTWTWFTNVTWGPQGAPYLSTVASNQQTFTFEYDGTNWVEDNRTMGDSGWIAFPFSNSWASYGGGGGWNTTAAYRRMHNRVEFMGACSGGSATATTIGTLPAGFRPTRSAFERMCSHSASNVGTRVSINTTGVVVASDWTSGGAGNFGFVDLSSLAFVVD